MPRPHHPTQGGPRHAAISHVFIPPAGGGHADTKSSQPVPQERKALNQETQRLRAEVERLQRELARANPNAPRRTEITHAIWIAVALCVGSLLFALAALARHG